ncbi:MAG: serine/threonine protein kinase, partial [Pseudomonadota bacterium]
GQSLVGVLGNVAGRYTSLLIVDDNGVVQDLRRFVTFSGGQVTFDVPMTRAGPARDTNQLLVVLATPGRPRAVQEQAGRLAEDFFAALEAELGTDPLISVVPFRVR